MKFLRPAVAVAVCLACLSLGSQRAQADLTLAFDPSASTTIDQGEILHVSIFLEGAGSLNSQNGLNGFGFLGTLGPGLELEPEFNGGTSAFEISSEFSGGQAIVTDNTPGAVKFTFTTSGLTIPGEFGDSIFLGKVALRGTVPGASALILADTNQGAFVTGNGLVQLDDDIFGPGLDMTYSLDVNVSAVPEPGSMSLVALASGGLWLARRRFRRAK